MNNINNYLLKSEVDYQRNLESKLKYNLIHQGTNHRESTNRSAPPPNSSLTLYLTISIYNTRSYGELIFS
jgi:hypothetical protein